MSNRKLVKELSLSDEEAQKIADQLLTEPGRKKEEIDEEIERYYVESVKNFAADTIIKGRILQVVGDDVLVDIGYKSEGVVPKNDFVRTEEIEPDKEIEVYLESVEDEAGVIALSKQKADKIRGWERIITQNKEGDVIRGRVIRKIKGGLLVDVGVPVFLPASQVDVRRVEDIGEYLGQTIECKILKIDEKRMNIIVSRRKLLEEQRAEAKQKLLQEIQEGDVRKGTVKNIADFGAFVDLGGIDGLLHITDMSWGRINHPTEVVKLEQEITVKVLKVDRVTERIALGLKQLQPNPWERLVSKYSVGQRVRGKVVNLMPYGAFVELEPGIEGLVHISEMSWTKRINHPSEVLQVGQEVEVAVLAIDTDKQELSLGLKQTEANPWDKVDEKYKAGMRVKGKVRNTTSYGAFVELEDGIDGLLHINDMSWTRKVVHPNEVVKKGDVLDVQVLSVDKEKKRIALGLKQLQENPWTSTIPVRYAVGNVVAGKVTKLVSFGAFVELEKDLEGLLHVSKVDKDLEGAGLTPGDIVEVKVVKLEPAEGKIGLSLNRIIEKAKPKEGAAPAAAE
ncbi:MAG TPA: 30S ribosomal protein S1 [Planctomycetota bacterium]|jgi:small subunit ribosomal protein S1|nr:30S ribosomal protein S1 [Planctomycetota bacterium]